MEKCSECGRKMELKRGSMPDGIGHSYYSCVNCGNEVLTMPQLHEVAEKYRAMKRYTAKLSKWGLSLGLRLPKELVKKYHLDDSKEVAIIPEKHGMRIVVEKS